MPLPFITRTPNLSDSLHLKLALSIFGDGFGYYREANGTSRAGPHEIERAVADVLGGVCGEKKKNVFDVVAAVNRRQDVGLSIKSKKLPQNFFSDFGPHQRVYMELSNSSAKLWEPLHRMSIKEQDFRAGRHAKKIGDSLIATVRSWWAEEAKQHQDATGRVLDLSRSVYLVISYGPLTRRSGRRKYIVQSFPLDFPGDIKWRYAAGGKGKKCLRGFDPAFSKESLFDWYGVSGGQLKYYPRSEICRYQTSIFELLDVPVETLQDKIERLFPLESKTIDRANTP